LASQSKGNTITRRKRKAVLLQTPTSFFLLSPSLRGSEKYSRTTDGKFAPYGVAALGLDMAKNKRRKTSNPPANPHPSNTSSTEKLPPGQYTQEPSEKIPQKKTESGDCSLPPKKKFSMTSSQQQIDNDQITPTHSISSIQQQTGNNLISPTPTVLENQISHGPQDAYTNIHQNQCQNNSDPQVPVHTPSTIDEMETDLETTPIHILRSATATYRDQPLDHELMQDKIEEREEDSEMDTESVDTIQEQPIIHKLSYSQVLKGSKDHTWRPNSVAQQRRLDQEKRWAEHIKKKIANIRETQLQTFDEELWDREKISESLTSPNGLREFIRYKLATLPTSLHIPPAIAAKFRHRDTAFFRSFTRIQTNKPQHQTEFNNLFILALEAYKKRYNVLATNKRNRNQLFDLLRAKLALDYLTNLDLHGLDAWEITRYLFYLSNFAKISTNMQFDEIRKLISEELVESRLELPQHYTEIHADLISAIPFDLPIENRQTLGSKVKALRLIFKFVSLPENYISDKRQPLPADYRQLHETVRKNFPIRDREDLKDLPTYRATLQKYYIFNRIPDTYFDLPPSKPPLPLTPQDLTPRLREKFPFLPLNEEDFKEHIRLLRIDYNFKRLPNDYLLPRKRLPNNPTDLRWKDFSFPMTTKEAVNEFFKLIPKYYNIPTPLPLAYANFNYTTLPSLPLVATEVEKVNLTTPITTRKQLSIAVQDLRLHYYFHKIPESWIDIKGTARTEGQSPHLPLNLEDLQSRLQEKNITNIQLPIKKHENIDATIEKLKEHFLINNIPSFLFDHLEDLPQPRFDLFPKSKGNSKGKTKDGVARKSDIDVPTDPPVNE